MIGRVNDVSVFQFASRSQFLKHSADLAINVFTARELAARLVANRSFITTLPDATDRHFVAQNQGGHAGTDGPEGNSAADEARRNSRSEDRPGPVIHRAVFRK